VKKFIATLALVSLAASVSGPTEAADSYQRQSVSRTVMTGVRSKLGQHWHIKNNCRLADVPVTRIVEAPKHGRVEIARERVFPDASGQYARCRNVEVPGLVLYYTARSGYTGKDKFVLRAPHGDGLIRDTTFNVLVLN
jgi:hypothetical protein